MGEETVRIEVDDEVTLAGGYTAAAGKAQGGAVVLHPHPLYGGSMHNNVVETLVRAALEAGWSALRFNFRGVGGSSGRHDEGIGEQKDVLAAASWLSQKAGPKITLLGYSFGSLVGARAAAEVPSLAGGVWVSPPLILGSLPPWPQDGGPLLIIAGTKDEFTSTQDLDTYVWDIGARANFICLEGRDHFWQRGESDLFKHTASFLSSLDNSC